ncbi:MAG: hypothetical protein ABIG44_00685 [Planctomycetota bacterium]
MCPEEIERRLSELPMQQLPAEADRSIVAAVLAAGEVGGPWWRRRLPAWQAIAACVAVTVSVLLLERVIWWPADEARTVSDAVVVQDETKLALAVHVDVDLLGQRQLASYRTDIARWCRLDP